MAGASYYLMSACQTADEFVSAFRRYAEKTLLFVPTATPLPNGTRARIAVTLADGSVMLEGDGEIVGSTPRAVGLHARPGMSVRFHELDDTSRQILDQLVRARLTSRPVPLPSHLRPRPRAGTVPEPSPDLQAQRRAQSTLPGMTPLPKVNAESLPAECTLVEVPAEGEAPRAEPARIVESGPAPRAIEAHVETTLKSAVPPARPLTLKGPAPGRAPAAAVPEPVSISQQLTAPEPSPIFDAVEEVSADSLEPADVHVDVEHEPEAEATMPEAAPIAVQPLVPSPPKLPATPRGRQSMSKTMLGLPATKLPAPPLAPTPAPAPVAWSADDHPPFDGGETQPMEPLFAAAPAPGDAGLGPFPAGRRLPPLAAPPHDTELGAPPIAIEPAPPFAPAFAQVLPPPSLGDSTDLIALDDRRRKRVMIASFGGALFVAVIVVVIATGGGTKSDAGETRASAAPPVVTIDAAVAAVVTPPDAAPAAAVAPPPAPPDAAVAAVAAVAPPPIAPGTCRASFTSTPPGADVVLDGKLAGTTPLSLALPCHGATATFRRARYQPKDVAFTPTSDGANVTARLDRPSFTVKISSTPPGATVTIAGKVVGKTPLTSHAPGFEAVSVTFKKDGFAPASAKLYAKANGTSIKATLRRAGAPAPKTAPKTPPRRH